MSADHVERTRAAYGDSAGRFAATVGTTISPGFEASVDQAMLQTFVDLARTSDGLSVDAGCGTGRVARYLADGGLDVLGIDVAPGMIDEARAAHPDIAFEVARLDGFPCAAGSVAAVAYWYSIITTPPDALEEVWSELGRTLAPGGVIVVAFQCGSGEQVTRPNAFGTTSDLTLFHHDLDVVCTGLESIGLRIHTSARRRPAFDHESTDQAFVIATGSR